MQRRIKFANPIGFLLFLQIMVVAPSFANSTPYKQEELRVTPPSELTSCQLGIADGEFTEEEMNILQNKKYSLVAIGAPIENLDDIEEIKDRNVFVIMRSNPFALEDQGWLDWLFSFFTPSTQRTSRVSKGDKILLMYPYRDATRPSDPIVFELEGGLSSMYTCDQLKFIYPSFVKRRKATLQVMESLSTDEGESEEGFGRTILGLEHIILNNAGEDYDLSRVVGKYEEMLSHIKDDIRGFNLEAIQTIEDFKPLRDRVVDILSGYGLGSDCQGSQQMTYYLLNGCADCNGNTRLVMSVWRDLDLPVPQGYQLGLQEFIDHVSPVIFNAEEQRVIDLYTWKYSDFVTTSIVDPSHVLEVDLSLIKPEEWNLFEGESLPKPATGEVLHQAEQPDQFPEDFPKEYIDFFEDTGRPLSTAENQSLNQGNPSRKHFPGSFGCYRPGCSPPPPKNQHNLFGDLDQGKPFEGDPPDKRMITEKHFCPFVLALPRSEAALLVGASNVRMTKAMASSSELPPGYFWMVDKFDLSYEAVRCRDDLSEARLVLEPKSREELEKEYSVNEPEMFDSGFFQNTKVGPMIVDETLQRLKFAMVANSQRFEELDKQWGRNFKAYLEVPKDECPGETISNALQLCRVAERFQAQAARSWGREEYPLIKEIASQRDLVKHFQENKMRWKNLKSQLQRSHLTLFNRAQPDEVVVRNLIKGYPGFPLLIRKLKNLRYQLGYSAAKFIDSFSRLPRQEQVEVIEVLYEISYHASYITRILREQGVAVEKLNSAMVPAQFTAADLGFGGGLTELVLRAFLQSPREKSQSSSEGEQQEGLQGGESVVSEGEVASTALESLDIEVPRVNWKTSQSPCNGGAETNNIGGDIWVVCPEAKPIDFEKIEVSDLLLPLLMSEGEREALRPQNLLMISDLWTETSEQALSSFKNVPFVKAFFESGTQFLGESSGQKNSDTFNWTRLAFMRLFVDSKVSHRSIEDLRPTIPSGSEALRYQSFIESLTDSGNKLPVYLMPKSLISEGDTPGWVSRKSNWIEAYHRVKRSPLFADYFKIYRNIDSMRVYVASPSDSSSLYFLKGEYSYKASMVGTDENKRFQLFSEHEDWTSFQPHFNDSIEGGGVDKELTQELLQLMNNDFRYSDVRLRKEYGTQRALQISVLRSRLSGGALWSSVTVSREKGGSTFNRPSVHYGRHLIIEKQGEGHSGVEIYPWSGFTYDGIETDLENSVLAFESGLLQPVDWEYLVEKMK